MSGRLLVAVPDERSAAIVEALAAELEGIRVVWVAQRTGDVETGIARSRPDAVLLHEGIGPVPALELARELTSLNPAVAFLLMADGATPDLLHRALRAGMRDVLPLPLTVDALSDALARAGDWSRAVRDSMDDDSVAEMGASVGGRMLVVAGAKGGVGTSMIALQLALVAARADPERPVCLAELDLQAGDLRTLLDIASHRSIADLVGVASEVGARSLDETLYYHESGLRVLLAPEHGEEAENIAGEPTRQIVAALKFQYDLVICDVGAVMTEASTVAVELADDALVVATPDVPALRAANRLLRLWARLGARTDGTAVALNRTSRADEVQPDLARRVVSVPLLETDIPDGTRELGPAMNGGAPERLGDGAVRSALDELAAELAVVAHSNGRRRLSLRGLRGLVRAGSGQVTVETIGVLSLALILILVLWQIALVGYTFSLAGHAARNGSRALAVGESVEQWAEEGVPAPWREEMRVRNSGDEVRVTMRVPLVIPGVHTPLRVTDRKQTVVEGGDGGLPFGSAYRAGLP